jgi:hypothetical protein
MSCSSRHWRPRDPRRAAGVSPRGRWLPQSMHTSAASPRSSLRGPRPLRRCVLFDVVCVGVCVCESVCVCACANSLVCACTFVCCARGVCMRASECLHARSSGLGTCGCMSTSMRAARRFPCQRQRTKTLPRIALRRCPCSHWTYGTGRPCVMCAFCCVCVCACVCARVRARVCVCACV